MNTCSLARLRSSSPRVQWCTGSSRTLVADSRAGGVVRAGEGPGGRRARAPCLGSGPTSLHLLPIEHPPVAGPGYVAAGRSGTRCEGRVPRDVTVFPDGQRFLQSTLASRPLAALHGESSCGGSSSLRLERASQAPVAEITWCCGAGNSLARADAAPAVDRRVRTTMGAGGANGLACCSVSCLGSSLGVLGRSSVAGVGAKPVDGARAGWSV